MNKRNPLYTKAKAPLAIDLLPRHLEGYAKTGILPPGRKPGGPASLASRLSVTEKMLKVILENTGIMISSQVIERGLVGRTLSIGTTPVKIIDGLFSRGYIILNPSSVSGALTSAGTILASALHAALATGNTDGAALGVANYRNIKLFLDISASGGGTVEIDIKSQDPVSNNWVVTQSDIFNAPSAIETYYADLGALGLDNSFAIDFTIGAGGDSTFSIGFVLKDGLNGTSSGLSNTIYLGSADVKVATGLPLLEGQKEKLWARDNTTLYAVSAVSGGTDISVFELQ